MALPTPSPALETSTSGGSPLGSERVALVDMQQISVQNGSPNRAFEPIFAGSSTDSSVRIEQASARTGVLSDSNPIEANISLIIGTGVVALDLLLTEATGLLERMPQSFPSGPASAGSSSSSSGGGSGFQLLGALALLSILLLGGKHLWPTREFLKPSAALLPIIERPG
jgi:hypothetical protein